MRSSRDKASSVGTRRGEASGLFEEVNVSQETAKLDGDRK
jgi:hypothetical protein